METILLVLIPATYAVMSILEHQFPGRPLPRVRGWFAKGLIFFVITSAISMAIPALVATALGSYAPIDLSGLGLVPAAVIAFLVSDVVLYAVHRLLHRVPFLWRWTHQMHHSAERIDVATSVYFHPFDLVVLVTTTSVPPTLLGISADAAALGGFIAFALQTFAHMNVRTPRWLGWIIQRPEAHAVHHARGVHAYNYGTVMFWDIAFGTFRNPERFAEEAGFWDGASAKIGSMLLGRDVSVP
jgi:sterol desaturase/sphingolipid hydroxylase (fatty acid hydroxylase superfamily)